LLFEKSGADTNQGSDTRGLLGRICHNLFDIVSSNNDIEVEYLVSFIEMTEEYVYDLFSKKEDSKVR